MIKSFSNNFEKLCNRDKSLPSNFVLGLSGGADSTVLLYLLKSFINNHPNLNINVYPIIIDHGLRSVSTSEALAVKNLAAALGFHAVIKAINKKKPKGNIQSWARDQRRNLLYEAAVNFSANLLLGHHYDDQAETIFMRLTRGSGIDGLIGIKEINFWNGIYIIRPLLIFRKEKIEEYIKINNINYFYDSSNSMAKYERVKTRKILKEMQESFWPKVSDDLVRLSYLNKNLMALIEPFFKKWTDENVIISETGAVTIDFENLKTLFFKSSLVTVKILGKILQIVGGKVHAPKKKKTLNLMKAIFDTPFKNRNLGNVNIHLSGNLLFFIREKRNILFDMEIKKNKYYIFDGRFLLISNVSGKLVKNANLIFDKENQYSIFLRYKNEINNSLPSIETLEARSIKPHLNIIHKSLFEKESIKDGYFGLYLINRLLV